MGSIGATRTRGAGFLGGAPVPNAKIQQTPTQNVMPTQQMANQANNANFAATDSSTYHQLHSGRQYFLNQAISIDGEVARQEYLAMHPEKGSMYSISQNLNYNLKHGYPLTGNQQYMSDSLSDNMHNLGYNLTLTRYDHMGFAEALGVKNYYNYTEQQLKNMLVGTTYTEKGFVSTSYDNFRNAPSSNPFTDREVVIEYRAPASTRAFMPGNGEGGKLGEIVLDKNQNYKVVDVQYTGKQGRNKASYYKQVKFVVEVQ